MTSVTTYNRPRKHYKNKNFKFLLFFGGEWLTTVGKGQPTLCGGKMTSVLS